MHLFPHIAEPGGNGESDAGGPLTTVVEQLLEDGCDLAGLENALIERAMERSGGNVTRAADLLGLTRATLDYRLKKARA